MVVWFCPTHCVYMVYAKCFDVPLSLCLTNMRSNKRTRIEHCQYVETMRHGVLILTIMSP